MFSRLSPWSDSPINSLANHSAVLSLFVAVVYYQIKGLDGHMPPVNKTLVRSRLMEDEAVTE